MGNFITFMRVLIKITKGDNQRWLSFAFSREYHRLLQHGLLWILSHCWLSDNKEFWPVTVGFSNGQSVHEIKPLNIWSSPSFLEGSKTLFTLKIQSNFLFNIFCCVLCLYLINGRCFKASAHSKLLKSRSILIFRFVKSGGQGPLALKFPSGFQKIFWRPFQAYRRLT